MTCCTKVTCHSVLIDLRCACMCSSKLDILWLTYTHLCALFVALADRDFCNTIHCYAVHNCFYWGNHMLYNVTCCTVCCLMSNYACMCWSMLVVSQFRSLLNSKKSFPTGASAAENMVGDCHTRRSSMSSRPLTIMLWWLRKLCSRLPHQQLLLEVPTLRQPLVSSLGRQPSLS